MKEKQFKAESKRLLDLMINSIYTNKEIFLRELISNASDALDKRYYNSMTQKKETVEKDKLNIKISLDKENKILTIEDNGCGMNKEELENNLGTIAKSGSLAFKEAQVDGALAASVFHKNILQIAELKDWLITQGVEMRRAYRGNENAQ